jgi:fluoroquinolone resistance protein
MERKYIEHHCFEKEDYSARSLTFAVYENCQFNHCNFAGANLSGIHFIECTFNNCNLSTATLNKTVFRDVIFKDSKLVGLHFENCDSFLIAMSFDNCNLQLSSFYGMKIKKTLLKNCILREVDFTDADLGGSLFDNVDLFKANFYNTNLEGADFRSAMNYAIDPEANRIQKARFGIGGLPGLLLKYKIRVE